MAVIAHEAIAQISPVAAEQFVATYTGKNDGNALSRKLGNEKCSEAGGVSDRFVHVPNELVQEFADFRVDDNFVMVGREGPSYLFCIRQFVVIGVLAFVTNGIGFHWTTGQIRHGRNDSARIHATAEECAEWHIANELRFHRFEELGADALNPFFLAMVLCTTERDIPIFVVLDNSFFDNEIVP